MDARKRKGFETVGTASPPVAERRIPVRGTNDDRAGLEASLRRLAYAMLPRGSKFEFTLRDDVLELQYLRCSRMASGAGTAFLCAVLAAADHCGLPTTLHADPSDEPDEPHTYDLVRWYRRFGFEQQGLNDQDWVLMTRAVVWTTYDASEVRQSYEEAKGRDLKQDEFAAWMDEAMAQDRIGQSYSMAV